MTGRRRGPAFAPARAAGCVLAGLLLILVAGTPPATPASHADRDGWGGNRVTQWLTYEVRPWACTRRDGATGYRLVSSSLRFRAADDQFTARWVRGRTSIAGAPLCFREGRAAKKKVLAPMPDRLVPGKRYTRYFGGSRWVMAPQRSGELLAVAKVDLYRGSAGRQARLCTQPHLGPAGGPCPPG